MMKNTILFLTLPLSFSLSAATMSVSVREGIANYGIPVLAETGLEALKSGLTPVRDATMQGFCTSHWSVWTLCWFLNSEIELQTFNLQMGLSKHLQDQVATLANRGYSYILAPEKAQGANLAEIEMTAWRKAITKAQSLESIKSRINLGQLRPILESLFSLTAGTLATPDSTQKAARIMSYATVLIATYFPDYNGDEPEIAQNARALLTMVDASHFRLLVEQEIAKQIHEELAADPVFASRVDAILSAWTTENANACTSKSLSENNTTRPAGLESASHTLTYMGLIAPTLLYNLFPQQKNNLAYLALRTALNSVALNGAEAATRVDLTDFFANMRRSVQRLGVEESTHNETRSDSYEILRQREFVMTQNWSELAKRMRANMLRYLALVVPSFAETSKLMSQGKDKEAASVMATLLAYIRQYDPEYKVDDQFLRVAAHGIFGPTPFPRHFLDELYLQLGQLDPGFGKVASVNDYYEAILKGFSDPQQNSVSLTAQDTPIVSVTVSLGADMVNAFAKELIGKAVTYVPGHGQFQEFSKQLVKETYNRFGQVIVRGVGEPAKDDIQQWLASMGKEQSAVEQEFAAGAIEMAARAGIDAQMARAIYERLQPILFHLYDGARESYQQGDKETAARLMAYAVIFVAYIYPEAEADDILISGLAKSRFSQFIDKNDAEFAVLLANKIVYFSRSDFSDSVLAGRVTGQLSAYELPIDPMLSNACTVSAQQSWYEWSKENAKIAAFGGVMVAVALLPAVVSYYLPAACAFFPVSNPYAKFALVSFTKGTVALTVNSVFGGITNNFLNQVKSVAQRWTQSLRATPRIDEGENSGRAQSFFGSRQSEVSLYLNPTAQEGRKDLLTVAQNIVQNLRNAKVAQLRGEKDFADSQISSVQYLLREFFGEATAFYEPIFADMSYAFFGKATPEQKQAVELIQEKEEL